MIPSLQIHALLDIARDGYQPFQVVALGGPSTQPAAVPFLQDRGLLDGQATAYGAGGVEQGPGKSMTSIGAGVVNGLCVRRSPATVPGSFKDSQSTYVAEETPSDPGNDACDHQAFRRLGIVARASTHVVPDLNTQIVGAHKQPSVPNGWSVGGRKGQPVDQNRGFSWIGLQ